MNIIQIPDFKHPDWNTTSYNNLIEPIFSPNGTTDGVVTFNPKNDGWSYIFSYKDIAPKVQNETYDVSIWINTDDVDFNIKFYTADNIEAGRIYGPLKSINNYDKTFEQWKRISWTFVNPENSESDSISFQMSVKTSFSYSLYLPELYVFGTRPSIDSEYNFVDLYKNKINAVVNIVMESDTGAFYSGSGAFISDDGYIITAAHVVLAGETAPEPYAKNVYVQIYPENDVLNAEIIGVDRIYDIAIIKVDVTSRNYFEWENSRDINIGEYAITLGQPLGVHTQAITTGVVRENKGSDYSWMPESVLIDGEIGPGNSGGPVISMREKIIGVLSWGFADSGFEMNGAISSSIAKKIADYIISKYKGDGEEPPYKSDYPSAYIGINYSPINIFDVIFSNLNKVEGVMINSLVVGSPADSVNLQINDVIIKANGLTVGKMNNQEPLGPLIHFTTIGQSINIDVLKSPDYDTVINMDVNVVSLPPEHDFVFSSTKNIKKLKNKEMVCFC
jgi:S1-C subfamily serine protease